MQIRSNARAAGTEIPKTPMPASVEIAINLIDFKPFNRASPHIKDRFIRAYTTKLKLDRSRFSSSSRRAEFRSVFRWKVATPSPPAIVGRNERCERFRHEQPSPPRRSRNRPDHPDRDRSCFIICSPDSGRLFFLNRTESDSRGDAESTRFGRFGSKSAPVCSSPHSFLLKCDRESGPATPPSKFDPTKTRPPSDPSAPAGRREAPGPDGRAPVSDPRRSSNWSGPKSGSAAA